MAKPKPILGEEVQRVIEVARKGYDSHIKNLNRLASEKCKKCREPVGRSSKRSTVYDKGPWHADCYYKNKI